MEEAGGEAKWAEWRQSLKKDMEGQLKATEKEAG